MKTGNLQDSGGCNCRRGMIIVTVLFSLVFLGAVLLLVFLYSSIN